MPTHDIGDRSRETLSCGSHPRFGQHPRFDRSQETPARGRNPRFGQRLSRLAVARLYLVCDSKPGGRELPDILRAAIAGGVEIVQLRDKRLSDEELTRVVSAAHTICEQAGVLLIVNDRPTVALEAGADGVHVGQEDMSVAQVRELVGPDLVIGLSTHAPREIDAAMETRLDTAVGPGHRDVASVDYIGVGPVYATPTKPGRPAVGLELVRYAAARSRLPFFAIGGIGAGNVAAVVEAGARRAAVVRAIADAADPEQAARTLRTALGAHDPERELAAR